MAQPNQTELQSDRFTMSSQLRTLLLAGVGLGIVCALIMFIKDDSLRTKFWSNFLLNSSYFGGIAFMGMFILAAFTAAYSGWHTQIKRVWEAMSLNSIWAALFMLVMTLSVYFHWHHLYHWNDVEGIMAANDTILIDKLGFLNKTVYLISTVVFFVVVYLFARAFRNNSLSEDATSDPNFKHYNRSKIISASFLPVAGFFSPFLLWLAMMSVDAHWYSTMYAWNATAGLFVACMSLTVLVLFYLKGLGHFPGLKPDHFQDLGKYIFGISIFWAYTWFSQFMLIWYGNVGEETIYFRERFDNYQVLFWANLIINFAFPFILLMRNDTKRKQGTMILASIVLIFGHWLDFFLMIMPGARINRDHYLHETAAHHGAEGAGHDAAHAVVEAAEHAASHATHILPFEAGFTLPSFLGIGMMLGFMCLFLIGMYAALSRASLLTKNDPYMEESLHHHVV